MTVINTNVGSFTSNCVVSVWLLCRAITKTTRNAQGDNSQNGKLMQNYRNMHVSNLEKWAASKKFNFNNFYQIMSLSELKENYYHTNVSETISIHTDIHILDTHKYLFESFAVNEGEL